MIMPQFLWDALWFFSGMSVFQFVRAVRLRLRFMIKGPFVAEEPEVLRRHIKSLKINNAQLRSQVDRLKGELNRLRQTLKEPSDE